MLKLSELIKKLEQSLQTNGDLVVYRPSSEGNKWRNVLDVRIGQNDYGKWIEIE